MDGPQTDQYGRTQLVTALVVGRSTYDFGHIVNHVHRGLNHQAQKARDKAIVEAQLHLSTILDENVGKSSFEHQATFLKARHVVGGSVKSSQITTCFENGTQSRQYLQRLNTYDVAREGADETIPTDSEHKRALVGTLVQAFKSTAIAKDKPKFLEGFAEKQYDNRLVEARCWQLLEFCIERSKRQALLRLWGGDKTKSEGVNVRDMKFADRYDAIVNVLATWKKSCDRVHQAPFLPQLVDNPDWTLKQTASNAVSNDRKAILLDIAKQAEEDGIEPYTSPVTTPSPTKRRKTISTASSSRHGSARASRSRPTIDQDPPPPFPSLPHLSPFQTPPYFDDFSLTMNQQHNFPDSVGLSYPRDSLSELPDSSTAPDHDLGIAAMGYQNVATNSNGSNMESFEDGLYSTPANMHTEYVEDTADLDNILGLGTWHSDSITSGTEATFVSPESNFIEDQTSYGYNLDSFGSGFTAYHDGTTQDVSVDTHVGRRNAVPWQEEYNTPRQTNVLAQDVAHPIWQDNLTNTYQR